MSLSTSILAYQDCKEFLERAVEDDKGARIPFRTEADANFWRMRCYQCRKLDREQNAMIYDLGHKMHGHSVYDELAMTIKFSGDGFSWVYAVKLRLEPGIVESLSEIDDPPLQITAEEMKMLEDQSNDNKTTT
jgi:hypothetical protein